MEFGDLAETGIPSNAIREVSLLKELDHPNIIKVEEVIYSRPKLYLIMELMETDLKKYIEENKPLSLSTIQGIMKQILCGVSEMHSSRAIHRDLKPENIFISSEGTL
jgi:serine/threonine protein kinase